MVSDYLNGRSNVISFSYTTSSSTMLDQSTIRCADSKSADDECRVSARLVLVFHKPV